MEKSRRCRILPAHMDSIPRKFSANIELQWDFWFSFSWKLAPMRNDYHGKNNNNVYGYRYVFWKTSRWKFFRLHLFRKKWINFSWNSSKYRFILGIIFMASEVLSGFVSIFYCPQFSCVSLRNPETLFYSRKKIVKHNYRCLPTDFADFLSVDSNLYSVVLCILQVMSLLILMWILNNSLTIFTGSE